MRVQPALQHALLEYRLCRDWRDWRPNWISFSTQPIACLHGNKVTAFLFCPHFCHRFPPVQASHGNALLGAGGLAGLPAKNQNKIKKQKNKKNKKNFLFPGGPAGDPAGRLLGAAGQRNFIFIYLFIFSGFSQATPRGRLRLTGKGPQKNKNK
jgi:hypothetical protein